jgi:hypothetical protein
MPLKYHLSLGPSSGHIFNKPVSLEIPLRSGPQNCRQSIEKMWLSKKNNDRKNKYRDDIGLESIRLTKNLLPSLCFVIDI